MQYNLYIKLGNHRLKMSFSETFSFVKLPSSCPEVSSKKGVFQNCAEFTGRHLCWSLFFDKVAVLRHVNLSK